MNIEIKKIYQEFFVDEEGLYSNLHIDLTVKPEKTVEFIQLDLNILSTSGSKDL